MDNYFMIAAVLAVIAYLFYLYGKLQLKSGYAKGYFVGAMQGTSDAFYFMENLGLVNLNELSKDISDGKYDHVPGLKNQRDAVTKLFDLYNKKV